MTIKDWQFILGIIIAIPFGLAFGIKLGSWSLRSGKTSCVAWLIILANDGGE
jgi:hypothetical protein